MKNRIKKNNLFVISISLVVSIVFPTITIIIYGFNLIFLIKWLIFATIAFITIVLLDKINNRKLAFAIWTVLFLIYVLLVEILRQPALLYTSGFLFGIIVSAINNKGRFFNIVSKGKKETSE